MDLVFYYQKMLKSLILNPNYSKTFSKEYERPSKPHMDRRLQSAEDFDKFKGLFTNPSEFL